MSLKHTANKILNLAVLDFKVYVRESLCVFWTFIFPFVYLLLAGLFVPDGMKERMGRILVPGLCTVVMITASMLGAIFSIVLIREMRLYELIVLLGMRPWEIMISHIVNRGVVSFIASVGLFIIGIFLFNLNEYFHIFSSLPLALLIIFVGNILFFNITVTLSSFFKSSKSAYFVSMILATILMILGGCYYDPAYLPHYLSTLSYYTPSFHLNNLLRGAFGGGTNILDSIFMVFVYIAIFTTGNCFFYDVRHKRLN